MSHRSTRPRPERARGVRPHVKWILIIGVLLMMAGMCVYILTMDESVMPRLPAPTTSPM
jgi:hypothetical protein